MKYFKIALVISFGLFFLTGCNTLGVGIQGPAPPPPHEVKYKKHGPPPHAPAHGYRHKRYRGHELVYDSGIGAYIVVNVPETYFGNDLYLRLSTNGSWMVSAVLEGGWRLAVGSEVPYELREYKKEKYKKKHKKGKKEKKGKKKYDD